jgi:hypothetical protein
LPARIDAVPGLVGHKVLIVIPTTRRPVVVASLKPRPQLPASFAVALGDFRALPIAADYDRLIGRSGPIGIRLADVGGVSHELRLSEAFESGRSWEVPVSLAHFVVAAGRTLATGIDDADLIVWSTGAVDIDLAIADQSYHTEEKIRSSLELFTAARGRPVIAFLPSTPNGDGSISPDLRDRVAKLGVELVAIASVEDALRRLDLQPRHEAAAPDAGRSRNADEVTDGDRRRGWSWPRMAWLLAGLTAALGAGLAAALVAGVIPFVQHSGSKDPKQPGNEQATTEPAGAAGKQGQARSEPAVAPVDQGQSKAAAESAARAALDAIISIDEHRAPSGRTCVQLLFSGEAAQVRTLRAVERKFPPSNRDGLCGLAARVADGSPYSLEFDPAFLAITMPAPGNARQPDTRRSARILRRDVPAPLTYWIRAHPLPTAQGLKELQFTHQVMK